MRGLHLGSHPITSPGSPGPPGRISFYVVDDIVYLVDPISGYTWEAPVTFVGPTTLPSGLITASEDTLLFHYSGGTWSSPATQSEGTAPVGGIILNDRYFVTIASITYEMPVTPVSDIPGVPGGDTSLVTIDGVEYLRIVFPDGEVRYEEVHETPTPDGSGGGAAPSDLPYDATLWDGNLSAATKNALRDKFESLYGEANVKSYGAVGDGVANDTAEIQAAIDSGLPVYVPAGTYLHSGLLGRAAPLSIRGDGESSILKMDATAAVALALGQVAPGIEKVRLRDLAFHGRIENLGGIKLGTASTYVAFASLERVRVQWFHSTYGISLECVQELDINNCYLHQNLDNIRRPATGYCTSTRITGAASFNGYALNRGINLLGSVQDITIQGVVLESNTNEAIYSGGDGSQIVIADSYFEDNCSATGVATIVITATSTKAKPIIERNHFHTGRDTSKPNLKLDMVEGALISSNSSLFGLNGNVVTTANTYAHFAANWSHGMAYNDLIPKYRALLGGISFLDYNLNLGMSSLGGALSMSLARWVAPVNATDPGAEGVIAWDNDFVYQCIGTNIWKRVPLATWAPGELLDDPYNATTWDGNLSVPTKNAVRDKIETLAGGGTGITVSTATDYIGGGSTKLDGEVTVGVSVPRIYNFKHTTLGWRQYLLRAGTDAEASPNVIRPDDYAASTNEKVFELMF